MYDIGIIFAMKEEFDELVKYLKIENTFNLYDLTFYEGSINNINYTLVLSGIGKVNAARTTQILIDNKKLDYIFNIGISGGIDNSLNVMDIVIGNKLVQHDFDITAFNHDLGYIPNIGIYLESDKYLVNKAENINMDNINIKTGTIATGDIFCTDKNMASRINQRFNALCVEMEGAAIAQVCKLSNIPYLIIRSISDVPNNNNVITYDEFIVKSSRNVAKFMYELLISIKDKS